MDRSDHCLSKYFQNQVDGGSSIENNIEKENLSILDNFARQISRFLILNIEELIEYFNILYSMFINWNNFCKNSNHID